MERVNVLPNQRIGIADYEDGAGGRLVQEDLLRQNRTWLMPAGRNTGSFGSVARIFGGFDPDPVTPNTTTLQPFFRGRGVIPYLDDDNVVQFGLMAGDEGPAQIIVDFATAAPSSVQAVWMRAVTSVATFKNRVFWNPSGAPAREFVDNVATRKITSWELTFQEQSVAAPGNGEWTRIAKVTLNGSQQVVGVEDNRHLYFEGDAVATFSDEWGDGANDRNALRSAYAITDNHMWTQAIRRQLGDILSLDSSGNNDGWYRVAPIGLEQVKDKLDHYVTVDQPSGKPGDYANISAAITALNAANGGTILLRSGTYTLSAAQTITKRINFVAVESGVVINNNLTTGWMLTFDAGSEGSRMEGLELKEGGSPSEQQLLVYSDYTHFIGCDILGEVRIGKTGANGEQVTFTRCKIKGSPTNVNSDDVIRMSNTLLDCTVKFDRCIIEAGNLSRTDTIFISGTIKGTIAFVDCRFQFGHGPRGFLCNGNEANASFVRCDIRGYPFSAGRPMLSFTSGEKHEIIDCHIEVIFGLAFVNYLDSVVHYSGGANGFSQSFLMSGTTVDFNQYVCNHSAETRAPIYLSGYNVQVQGCRFFRLNLWNTTEAPSMDCFINLNPVAGGHIAVSECRIWRVFSSGSGTISSAAIGQSDGETGTGCLHFNGCIFDGSEKVYKGASDGGRLLWINGDADNIHITNNYFFGGTWNAAVDVDLLGAAATVLCTGNEFLFGSTPVNMDEIVRLGASLSEGASGLCMFNNNFVVHTNLDDPQAVLIQGHTMVARGNIMFDLANQVFGNAQLHGNVGTNFMARENVLDETVTVLAATNSSIGDNIINF